MNMKRKISMLLILTLILTLSSSMVYAEGLVDENNIWDDEVIVEENNIETIEEAINNVTSDENVIEDELTGRTIIESGTYGDNIVLTLYSDGVLTISGSGTIGSIFSSYPWYPKRSEIKKVIIDNGVTCIGMDAFRWCENITCITIPKSVTAIKADAFAGCSSLSSITIPESVKEITSGAFYRCSSLKTAGPIGSGCDYQFGWTDRIPSHAFCECSGLTSITIPSSITEINTSAFANCSNLTSITIPSGVTHIGDRAFYGCSSLTSITIPSGVTRIFEATFSNCSNLTSITIPSGVTSIYDQAFYGCSSLTSITIPGSVIHISDDAFWKCENLNIIYSVKDSYVEKFAKEKGYKFIEIASEPNDTDDDAFYMNNETNENFISTTLIEQKLLELKAEYPGKKPAFTQNGQPCSAHPKSSCANCMYYKTKDKQYSSMQCTGFANYVLEYLYGDGNYFGWENRTGAFHELGIVDTTSKTKETEAKALFDKAQVGDLIVIYGGSAPKYSSRHYMIYLGQTNNGKILVYHANGDTRCSVKFGEEISINDMLSRKLLKVWRFNGYEEVNVKTQCNQFIDIDSNAWYVDAVKYAYLNNIMSGVGNRKFDPNAACTRAMMVTILWSSEGSPFSEKYLKNVFVDVQNSSKWYYHAIQWAYNNNVASGKKGENGLYFDVDGKVTRQEMAAFLYSYAKMRGYDLTAQADLNKYTDASQIASWAAPQMQWANANGIINGKGGGKLDPKGNATRAEVAAMIMSFQNKFGK